MSINFYYVIYFVSGAVCGGIVAVALLAMLKSGSDYDKSFESAREDLLLKRIEILTLENIDLVRRNASLNEKLNKSMKFIKSFIIRKEVKENG